MMEMIKALKEVYDVEDCKYILEGGCVSGCARKHIYYSQTNSFYDLHQQCTVLVYLLLITFTIGVLF